MLDALGDYRPVFVAVCSGLIILRGVQLRSLRLYPFFYLYVFSYFISIPISLIGVTVLGAAEIRYLYLYISLIAVTHVTTALFLVSLIAMISELRKGDLFAIVCFLLFAILFEVAFPGGHFVWHLWRGGFFFLILMALLATFRCIDPMLSMGRNMAVALSSTFVMLILESLNAHSYLSSEWAFENFQNLSNFGAVTAWGIMAWGMWDCAPPKKEKLDKQDWHV